MPLTLDQLMVWHSCYFLTSVGLWAFCVAAGSSTAEKKHFHFTQPHGHTAVGWNRRKLIYHIIFNVVLPSQIIILTCVSPLPDRNTFSY